MRRRFLRSLRAFVLGCSGPILIVLSSHVGEAAVVRSVTAVSSPDFTEIRITCGPAPVFRSGVAGEAYLVEIEDAELEPGTPRLLPVMDSRVHGVVVSVRADRRVVRVRVDLARHMKVEVQPAADETSILVRIGEGSEDDSTLSTRALPERPRAGAPRRAAPFVHEDVPSAEEEQSADAAPSSVPRRSGRPLIVIDPGHGGKDPGAEVWTGEYEKDIALAIATSVAERLRKRLDVDVVMTRTADEFVSLKERRAMVRRWDADLFVSIHANASPNEGASGVETYYAAAAGNADRSNYRRSKTAAKNGDRSNFSRPVRSGDRSDFRKAENRTSPLAENWTSPRLARAIQGELVRHLGMRYKAVRDLGVKEGRFYVLQGNDVPSVLVEAAFLTHREEGIRIRSESYRDQAAEGIVGGIAEFLAHASESSL